MWLHGIPIEATQMFCKNRQENKERESSFEIQITVSTFSYVRAQILKHGISKS